MSDGLMERLRKNYNEARQRETKYLMSFDLPRLNNRIVLLLLVFITLNGLDVLTTLVALSLGPPFVELNPIASQFFGHDYIGFIGALSLKFMPLIPFGYIAFMSERPRRPVAYRVVKVAAFIALCAGVVVYVAIVGSNGFTLIRYFYWR